ncbi:golgin-45 isoform 3 [Camelus ferus]|nr:golgin-45 isoform 3 [Camelus ferus]
MATLESLEAKVLLTSTPIRGAGDGMETEEPPKSIEVTSGIQPIKHHILQSPRKKAVPSESPGVLQLGKILAEKAVEVEAVRILVPKAAIIHDIPNKNAKVNRELKKLLVASVGDDLQYHFERLSREKNQLILENETLGRNIAQLSEQLERMSIQCDVWRSKFLASRVMADELTNSRAVLQRQNRDAQSAIQDLLSEREQFRPEMLSTQKYGTSLHSELFYFLLQYLLLR